ncbi:MAG: SRPBCC family protein [Rhodothermales bacterium]
MTYSNEVVINLPVEKVITLFDSEENMFKWQPELLSVEHLSGEKGKAGAKMAMRYKMGKREVDMVETIKVNELPKEFTATYEAKGVWNEMKNYFEEIDPETTRWRSDSHFEFSGFMKLMGFFMPGAFKKQSQQSLERFKTFAEASSS